MDCQQITQAPVALVILQTPEDKRLEPLFRCIYSLFQGSFLNWILKKYGTSSSLKDKLLTDAKDAFQNGLMAFYLKATKEGFTIKGSLKTTIFSFGLLQLLACFKKDRASYGFGEYLDCIDLFLEDDVLEGERQHLLNEREIDLLEALKRLPRKQGEILALRFFNQLRSKQIAEKLDMSVDYVDNETARAYKALRQILKEKLHAKWN